MLQGKCPNCGYECVGWALALPRHQTCPKCGTALDITYNGLPFDKTYSPFTTEEYTIDMLTNVPSSTDNKAEEHNR
jgi:hypothetical protein